MRALLPTSAALVLLVACQPEVHAPVVADTGPTVTDEADVGPEVRSMGLDFEDHGNVEVREPESAEPADESARFLPEIADCCVRLRHKVEALLEDDRFPLVVGGDHSIAVGTIAGLTSHYHKRDERVGLIWFDAHGDMNTPGTTHSGNIHGMPLAACLGHFGRHDQGLRCVAQAQQRGLQHLVQRGQRVRQRRPCRRRSLSASRLLEPRRSPTRHGRGGTRQNGSQ